MENQNLLKPLTVLFDNNFYINIIYPLMITKINLEDNSEVNSIFEMLAFTIEKFILKKEFFKLNIEQNSFSKLVVCLLKEENM